MDIHNYKKRYERTVRRIKESDDISEENKRHIFNFKNYLLSENIGIAKIERYLLDLMKYSRMLNKSFENASKEDIRRVIGEINQTDLAEETKRGFKILLRKFYRFLEGIEEKGKYPERVCWISTNLQENHKKLPEELLAEEEIKRIIEKCDNLRDRALISVLAESGCRISETETFRDKFIWGTKCDGTDTIYLKHSPVEFGDILEFDFSVHQIEDREVCPIKIYEMGFVEYSPQVGDYHFKGINNRNVVEMELTLPDGSLINASKEFWTPNSGLPSDGLMFYNMAGFSQFNAGFEYYGCGIDLRIDNLKIYKHKDSLGYETTGLWNALFDAS